MKENLLSIKIDVSARDLYLFTINPNNTNKWIDLEWEYIDTETIQIWTIYTNYYKNEKNENIYSSYVLSNLIENKLFHIKSLSSKLEAIYFYNEISENESILNYYEFNSDWSDLSSPLWINSLIKLKQILENNN